MRHHILPFVLLACALLLASGCTTVPVTGRRQLMLTSTEQENSLGATAYAEYKKQYKPSSNAQYNAVLSRVGTAISKVAGRDDFEWEFIVLESKEQNAFCLPGGKVAVYSGIMDIMRNEAELACVVGHEIGHAIARHGGERQSWGVLQSLGAKLFSSEYAQAAYGIGTQVGVILPFSRQNESEADYIGLVLMAKAGYDPAAAVQFWQRFGSDEQGALEAFLSTHPTGPERIKDLQEKQQEALQYYNSAADRKGLGETLKH